MTHTPRTFEEWVDAQYAVNAAYLGDGEMRFGRNVWKARDEEIEELKAMLSQAKRAFVELTKIQGEGARRIATLEAQTAAMLEKAATVYGPDYDKNGMQAAIRALIPTDYAAALAERVRESKREEFVECDCDPEYAHHCFKCGGTGKIRKPVSEQAGAPEEKSR